MSYPVTHVVVKDNPPPRREVISVGRLYAIPQGPEVVFSTVQRAVEGDEKSFEEEAETKVVKRRGRRPAQANEAAETK